MLSWQKLGLFLQIKDVQKLNVAKNVYSKICSSNPFFLQKNIFRKMKSILDSEMSLKIWI